jgi:excisionase family DNA binding protein
MDEPIKKVHGLVNADEIARILNVPKSWVYERTRQGQKAIPFIRLGAYVRFETEAVINFFKSKED